MAQELLIAREAPDQGSTMNDHPHPGSQAAPQPLRPEPFCALLVMCIECGMGIELTLPIDTRTIGFLLAQHGWFISRMGPPDQGPEVPVVLGPLCTACAQQVYSPEMFAAAEQRRQQLLQAAQVQVPQGKTPL
jgi:hypothetical protein